MAGIIRRTSEHASPRGRSAREVLRRGWARPLRFEPLEDRVTPTFIQSGIPFWLESGPFQAAEGGVTGISGAVPNPTSGAVEEVAPHPTDPNILFAAGVNGGVWRTTNALNGNPTWTPLTDQMASLSVGDMDLNPANPNQLLAGVGRFSSFLQIGGDLIGALYTENATAANPQFRVLGHGVLDGLNIQAVIVRPYTKADGSPGTYMLAAGQRFSPSVILNPNDPNATGVVGNVFRSLDNGQTWLAMDFNQDPTTQLVPGGPPGDLPGDQNGPIGGLGRAFEAAADPADPKRVYLVGPTGVYRTDDITVSSPLWYNISQPFMGFGAGNVIDNAKIAIHYSKVNGVERDVVYLATTSGDLVSIGYSLDRGASWTPIDRPQSLTDAVQITDASFATPIVITTLGPHGLTTGDRVYVQGVTGNLGANAVWTITVTAPDKFSLNGSAGTGLYTGGGTVAKIFFTHPGLQSDIHLSLAADPVNPNLVYIGGDRQEILRTFPNQTGAVSFTSNLFRGDRSLLPGQGSYLQSPQWTEITGTGAANNGSPHADSRALAFDAQGSLVEGDDGGVYKRFNPTSSTGSWVSLIGNMGLGQFVGVSYDVLNNVVFGGEQDTSVVQQLPSKDPAGSRDWETAVQSAGSSFRFSGDGGPTAVDNVSVPGSTIRMQMIAIRGFFRETYNANGALTNTDFALFQAPDKIGMPPSFNGVTPADANAYPFPGMYALNELDPRIGLIGVNDLYEDNNPASVSFQFDHGLFDVVAKVTPAGMTGTVSSIVYGGKQILSTGEKSIPRVAWVGTSSGQVFLRGPADGFFLLNVPGSGGINDIAVDPDDYRTAYVARGGTQVFATTDGGATWTDITENLVPPTVTDPGTGAPIIQLNADGTPFRALSTELSTLAVYDSAPGQAGGTVLLAGGRGGVFRYAKGIVDPAANNGGSWIEFGAGMPNAYVYDLQVTANHLIVGTQGRGAWIIPDLATALQPATLTVLAAPGGSDMSVIADPSSPTFIIVSDGQGNTLRLDRAALQNLRFVGTADGVDTVTVAASGTAGGDLSYLQFLISVDLGGTPGDTLTIRNAAADAPVRATITGTTVGGAPGDTLFSGLGGARVEYIGLENGTLDLDLGADAADGNQVFVQSTTAGTTRVEGGARGDEVRAGSSAGVADDGSLDAIGGGLAVDGRGGADVFYLSDYSSGTANGSVRVGPGVITGLTGSADQYTVQYANVADLIVSGNNSPSVGDFVLVDNPTSVLTVFGVGGPDTVLVRANTLTVTVDGGAGDNRLIVDRFDSPTGITATIANNAIIGATAAQINFFANGGRYFAAAGDGVRIIGSNNAADLFNFVGGLSGSQIAADGNGGDDTFVAVGAKLIGSVLLRGGDGSDRFNVDAEGGNKATAISIAGGGGGNDVAAVAGSAAGDDNATVTVTDAVSANLTGLGGPIFTDHLTTLAVDGRRGHNFLTFVDGTAGGYGSASDPLAGIVFKPTGGGTGEIRLAGGAVGPVVAFAGMDGRDTDGFVVVGAGGDTLTVLLASDVGLAGTGPLVGVETNDGSDTVSVSDQIVTSTNRSIGYLRAVAIARGASGRPTVGTLVVRTGNEAGVGGDHVTAVPSSDVNIVIDGEGPTRRPGDSLTVDTTQPTSLARVGALTRVTTAGGQGLGFTGFESIDTSSGTTIGGGIGRSGTILAVGADQGGGPRVQVKDAATQAVLFDRFVYVPTFTGGVRVATGDVNGDGVADVIVGAGYGGGPHVQVFDGVTFQPIANFFAYENTFRGGMYVAAGDLDGDGKAEIITGVGLGGGPLVKVFDGTGRQLSGFFAYDPNFRGGVRVGAGDVNGDGNDDIVTGAGPGGGPHIKVFNAGNLALLDQFLADAPDYTAGVFVAAGDLTGDGAAEVIVGPGGNDRSAVVVRRSGTHQIQTVSVFDVGIINSPGQLPAVPANVLSAVGSESREEAGIRVAASDFAGANGRKTIVTARGPGYAPRVNFYSLDPPVQQANFLAFEPQFLGGLFVG